MTGQVAIFHCNRRKWVQPLQAVPVAPVNGGIPPVSEEGEPSGPIFSWKSPYITEDRPHG